MDPVEVVVACENETLTFHWADYLVFGVFLTFSTLLGVFVAYRDRKISNSEQFLMGGGDMHWIPVALSMQASFISAIFILSTPTEIYSFGTLYSYIGLSYFIGIPIAGYMYLPIFYRLKVVSAYEYLERRFNRSVRVAGSFTFCLMVLLYMSVVLYTPAIALAQVTGLPLALSIPLCGVVCVIYTFLGGMKATVWNDFFQMIVITIGLLVMIIVGAIEAGGPTKIWNANVNGSRIQFNEFNPDPTIRVSFWTQTVGGAFVSITLYASSQTIIQKFLSVKTLKNAQKSLWLAACTSLVFLVLVVLLGLVMYGYYAQCDPVLIAKVDKADQMVPLFVMEILGPMPGLPGLFIATTFSAALSSVSGSLNALSAVTLYDFIRPAYKKVKGYELNGRTCSILSRVLTLLYGIFTIIMGFVAQYLGDFVLQIAYSVFGFLGGPVLALLTIGMFFPFVNSWGALSGLFSSLIICCWIAIGTIVAKPPVTVLSKSDAGCPVCYDNITWTTEEPDPTFSLFTSSTDEPAADSNDVLWIYKVSYMYYSLIAILVAIIVAVPVSLLTGRARNVDRSLVYDFGSQCCCYCPAGCRSCLHCGATISPDNEHENDDEEIKIVAMSVEEGQDAGGQDAGGQDAGGQDAGGQDAGEAGQEGIVNNGADVQLDKEKTTLPFADDVGQKTVLETVENQTVISQDPPIDYN